MIMSGDRDVDGVDNQDRRAHDRYHCSGVDGSRGVV